MRKLRRRFKRFYKSARDRWNAETPRVHRRIITTSNCVFSVSTYAMAAVHSNTQYVPAIVDQMFFGLILITQLIAGYSHFQQNSTINQKEEHDDK